MASGFILTQSPTSSSGTPSGSMSLVRELVVGSPTPPAPLGDNSVVVGAGAQTAVGASNSLAIGNQSLARHPGSVIEANGRFASSGDAQVGRYILRTVTVNGSPTEAFLDGTGGTQRLVLPDDATWTFNAKVVAHRTDASGGHAGYTFNGVVYRESGAATSSVQGTVMKTVLAESDPLWDAVVDIDNVNGSLRVRVQGQAGKIIRWVVSVETVEVTN